MKTKTNLIPPAKSNIAKSVPVLPLRAQAFEQWLAEQPSDTKAWIKNTGFKAQKGRLGYIPAGKGSVSEVLLGMGEDDDPWLFGDLPALLPPMEYRIATAEWENRQLHVAALAWGLGSYVFRRYTKTKRSKSRLIVDTAIDYHAVQSAVIATYLVRNLINTPAEDMTPEALAEAAETLATVYGAQLNHLVGERLLSENYPLIHAVGRASRHDARLIDLCWGNIDRPKVTLVGKGVCFDSGGLDIKPAASMRLMKKDMGGGAHVLGLADMIMAARLPVRLRVLIPAVENAIAGNAIRPGDVLPSRKGLNVEIDNTDAEGRLILCDALAEAASDKPELIIDFATLTGAARVALGTEIPALFCNRKKLSDDLMLAAEYAEDPIWPLPLHTPYRASLDSNIADIANSSSDGFAGAITAALFLQEFLPSDQEWVHLDVMGWNTRARPGRPIGGEAMGMRAVFNYLQHRFN